MTVTLYSKPSCVQCTATKRMLDNKGIEYNTVDVSADEAALEFVKSLGHQAAPVVTVKDSEGSIADHWSMFRADKLAKLAV